MKNIFLSLLLFSILSTYSQEQPSPILFIYDASGSMWGQLNGKTKKEIASNVLETTINRMSENQNIGLIAYGHRSKGDCNDIEYMVNLSNTSKQAITNAIDGINPLGKTPLALSATLAINSLKMSNTKATIILITDGIESCDGDLCQIVTDAKANGIDFKLHIVGFGLKDGEKEQLKCSATAGGGNYYDANDTTELGDGLTEATSQTIDKPKGNFSVYAVKNRQSVDAWVRARNLSTKLEVDASRTYRDTAFVYLSSGKYEIEIVPLENTDIPGTSITVEINQDQLQHHDISFDSGILEVTTTNNGEPWDAVVKMYYAKTGKLAANTRTYSRTKQMEFTAGIYKIKCQALNLKGIETYTEIDNVEIKSNITQSISHDFKSGTASVGVQTAGGELIDATVNFYEKSTGENVAAARTYTTEKNNPRQFTLNPGTYEVKIVTLGVHKGNKETFTLKVRQGETTEKIITY